MLLQKKIVLNLKQTQLQNVFKKNIQKRKENYENS